MEDLSALLNSARSLNAHIGKPDRPVINRNLEQIESDTRNLISRLPGTDQEGRATYLLARGNVDAMGLAREIAELDTTATFQPLQPLADNDVQGYLRHVHEQTLISTIEESRRETRDEFYRVMEERVRRDWETQKKLIFEELGGRSISLAERNINADIRKSVKSLAISSSPSSFAPTLEIHNKMTAYEKAVSELNTTRLKGRSYPILHGFMDAAKKLYSDETSPVFEIFQYLSNITEEPSSIPPTEHAAAHTLNAQNFERKFSRAYLGTKDSRDALGLRKQILQGSRRTLEQQYDDMVDKSIRSNPIQAQLGGDPSYTNRIRAFVSMKYYKSGRWDDRIELVRGHPEWVKLFLLVRTGHAKEALDHALSVEQALNQKENHFLTYFQAWIESGCSRLPSKLRDRLQTTYNSHLLHSPTTDPFKLALFKLMGRLDPTKRNLPYVTSTTEDWLWLQLAMADEDQGHGLENLRETLLSYGDHHFEGPVGRKGTWARMLVSCGAFEMGVASLYAHQELQVEAVHLAIALAYYGLLKVPTRIEASEVEIYTQTAMGQPTLNLYLLISRYVRQFMRSDPKEAMQYVYNICLNDSQGSGVGKEQVELAWELTRRIIVNTEYNSAWEELVGTFRPDGVRVAGLIEQSLPLLKIEARQQYYDVILLRAAAQSESQQRLTEAIRLYHLAGAHSTVISCLARGLGEYITEPDGGGEEARSLENTARELLRHYDRTNRVTGQERDTVVQLLGILEAIEARRKGKLEAALEAIELTEILPLDGDTAMVTARAAEFREQDNVISQNLHVLLPLTMEVLEGLHQAAKKSMHGNLMQERLTSIRKKARALMTFAGSLRYRLSPDVHSYLMRLDVAIAL